MTKFKDYFNKITNDGRIFSFEDVVNIPSEEDKFYSKALEYQYGKIGFPRNKELQASSNVVYVHAYTRDDGTKVRAHYRSKTGHLFADKAKPDFGTPKSEKLAAENWADRTLGNNNIIGSAANIGMEYFKNKGKEIKEKNDEKMYNYITSPKGKDFQKDFPQKATFLNDFKNCNKYYRIALTHGNSVNTTDNDNYKGTVKNIKNERLKKHLLNLKNITPETMVIVPKQNSKLINDIKNSPALKNFIQKHLSNMKIHLISNTISPISFYSDKISEKDLSLTLGNCHVYNFKFDKNANLNMHIIDYYDFEHRREKNPTNAINNNAFEQQEKGELTNYILAVPISLTPDEWRSLINMK